jgi:hypothetical protein
MSREHRVMVGVAVGVVLLSTVGAASVADHSTYSPANDPTTKINHSYVDDKDDDANDLAPSESTPCHGAWQGGDCATR